MDIYPTIDIEPRFYYGLDRRAGKERSVAKNTGSFVSVQMKTVLPFAYVVSDNDTQPTGLIFISPLWGLRRIWNRHWLFEFSAGVSLFKENRKGIDWLPALNVRFGYSF